VSAAPEPLRPCDFALLLLASGDLAPRQRARDQQADLAGMGLKRRILDELAARDPEPQELEGALLTIVEDLGPPTGPTRSVALALLEDWRVAVATPEWVAHLLGEAVTNAERPRRREAERGTRNPAEEGGV
jgi:hypothetical protein